eukprot:scaffold13479_cov166-Amphora_coffeaeformis.AAC.6
MSQKAQSKAGGCIYQKSSFHVRRPQGKRAMQGIGMMQRALTGGSERAVEEPPFQRVGGGIVSIAPHVQTRNSSA